jgi:hypothetical protein
MRKKGGESVTVLREAPGRRDPIGGIKVLAGVELVSPTDRAGGLGQMNFIGQRVEGPRFGQSIAQHVDRCDDAAVDDATDGWPVSRSIRHRGATHVLTWRSGRSPWSARALLVQAMPVSSQATTSWRREPSAVA